MISIYQCLPIKKDDQKEAPPLEASNLPLDRARLRVAMKKQSIELLNSQDLDNFHWFCLKHVKEYNTRLNYFKNHSEEENEKELNLSKTWGRKTHPFGSKSSVNRSHSDGNSKLRFGIEDPYNFIDGFTKKDTNSKSAKKRLNHSEQKALSILGAAEEMTKNEIRKLYKVLIKDLHPDTNDGKRDDEEE